MLQEEIPLCQWQLRSQSMIWIPLCLAFHRQSSFGSEGWRTIEWVGLCKLQHDWTYLIAQGQHDPIVVTLIGHASMPCSQIPEHDVSFLANRLNRWSDLPPFLSYIMAQERHRVTNSQSCVGECALWCCDLLVLTRC
jgi:hypothetical protein